MKAVLNAGPIISLSETGHLAALKALFTETIVPEAVSHEVIARAMNKVGSQELSLALKEGWIEVRKVRDQLAVKALQRTLGRGKCEAIILALEEEADFVIIDDLKGRREAARMGLNVIGALGTLKRAKELGVVKEDLGVILQKLKTAGFHVSKAVERDFLE